MKQYQTQLRETGWNKEQDFFLGELVETHGTHNWKLIGECLSFHTSGLRRSGKDCHRRWKALVNGQESKRFWTEQEELDMILGHYKYKNNWSLIAETLFGWDKNTIKNKFYSAFRRIRGKIIKSNYIYDSKVELLEIYYITSLIQCHLEQPTQFKKSKGRRGKDYIYSLVQDITLGLVKDYKERLQKQTASEGTMEELFEELGKKSKTVVDVTKPRAQEKQSLNKDIKDTTSSNGVNKEKSKGWEDEEYFHGHELAFGEEISLSFGVDFRSPASLFSPQCLSMGPAAAAANAQSAVCFTDAVDEFNRSSLLGNSMFDRSEMDLQNNLCDTLVRDANNNPKNFHKTGI